MAPDQTDGSSSMISSTQHRAILRRYRDLARPDVPIRAVIPAGQAERYAALLVDIELLTHDATVADLDGFASEVEAADRI